MDLKKIAAALGGFCRKNAFYLILAVCAVGIGTGTYFAAKSTLGGALSGLQLPTATPQADRANAGATVTAAPTKVPTATWAPSPTATATPTPHPTKAPSATATPVPTNKPTATEAPQKLLGNYIVPAVGTVSKVYSEQPVYSNTMGDFRTHTGIDIAAPAGTQVKAANDGTIRSILSDPMWGMTVIIDHPDGRQTVYQNLSDTLVAGIEEGLAVKAGQVIGCIGTTSLVEKAEPDHLHFCVLENGLPVDPGEILP